MDPRLYEPVAPPKWERRRMEVRQALRLPKTLLSIHRIVRQDFGAAMLDEYLWSFWGFHHRHADLHYRMRPWQKVQLRSIEPSDVAGLAVWEMALMVNIAMENEEPILAYTEQSGEGFRYLLPTLGRYMGKNEEQARFAAQNGLAWCEGPWCAEERRHSNALARIIERLTKKPPRRDNPNQPMVVTADEEAALSHLTSRQTTEWNASSSYIVMAAHATGHLHGLIRNLERDEVKHLCIISAAGVYLLGWRPWGRFRDLVRKGVGNYERQKESRSGGDVFGTNPITAIEGITAHLLTEYYLRKWLETVPLRTLTTVFETPSSIPEPGQSAVSPERMAEIEDASNRGKDKRLRLDRWAAEQRQQALRQGEWEESHQEEVARIVESELGGFENAEDPGSDGDRAVRGRIRRLTGTRGKEMRATLLDRLRDFQIRNNYYAASQCSRIPAPGRR
jgi:hypothetical protein